jgi:hypothetical protein
MQLAMQVCKPSRGRGTESHPDLGYHSAPVQEGRSDGTKQRGVAVVCAQPPTLSPFAVTSRAWQPGNARPLKLSDLHFAGAPDGRWQREHAPARRRHARSSRERHVGATRRESQGWRSDFYTHPAVVYARALHPHPCCL